MFTNEIIFCVREYANFQTHLGIFICIYIPLHISLLCQTSMTVPYKCQKKALVIVLRQRLKRHSESLSAIDE